MTTNLIPSICHLFLLFKKMSPDVVAHSRNPSCSAGRDWENYGSGPARAKHLQNPYLNQWPRPAPVITATWEVQIGELWSSQHVHKWKILFEK
jgi:hypothetical protein